jgi:hypothetical protein
MHSQLLLSSPLVSTNTTISNSSVVGGRQCSRHSVSQSAVSQTRRMCVLRSLSPAPADQPISKLICSRGQFHKVSCNSIQQTARKADCRHHGNVTGMENYTTDGKTWPENALSWRMTNLRMSGSAIDWNTGEKESDVTPQTRRWLQPGHQPKISPLTERHRLPFGGIPNISHAMFCHKCPFRGIPNAFTGTRHAEAFGGAICVCQ